MTNPDRCRQEFEKWYEKNIFIDSCSWETWRTAFKLGEDLATQATARLCVEICKKELNSSYDEEPYLEYAIKNISQEFGLQGE